MSWTRYLLHDFWTARALNEMDDERQRSKRAARQRSMRRSKEIKEQSARIDELEQDLAETTLLLRALADLSVSKGLITADEISERALELDKLDGVVDGRMGDEAGDSGA